MGVSSAHQPVLLILAAFSRYDAALQWARQRCESEFGPVARASQPFEFDATDYYEASMGAGLRKQFLAFAELIQPERLPAIKQATNQWERDYATTASHPERRPLNLDPGYVTLGKLVLASTKDHAHRIYLGSGIYGEVTLHFQHRSWRHHERTFRDYRRADYHAFFDQCRDELRRRRKGGPRRGRPT